MAAAYSCIANGGKYIEPIFYTKVENSKGKVVLKNKQKNKKVYSEDTAYILKNLLTQPVKGENGTAKSCKIDGFEVAAKTGTTNDNYDKWLCGFTNYYTAACWYGFDKNEEVTGSNNVAGRIWDAVMTKVHSGLESSRFDKPNGVVSATICRASGKSATSKCTDTYSEIFVEGTVPGECDAHSNSAEICEDTGLLANEHCPNKVTKYYSYIVEKERLGLWDNINSSVSSAPTTYCTEHKKVNTDTAPKITLKGEANITLNVGDKYTEQGATAKDDTDGDISNKISTSGSVDTSKAGKYTITYKVKNSKGKESTATRTITVKAKETPKKEDKKEENKTEGNTTPEKENTTPEKTPEKTTETTTTPETSETKPTGTDSTKVEQ
jgi:penicillin-binding protein 1A